MKALLPLLAICLSFQAVSADVTIERGSDQTWRIQSPSLGLNFDNTGNLARIERLTGKDVSWSHDLLPKSFWAVGLEDNKRLFANDASSVSVSPTRDALGVGLIVQSYFKAAGLRITTIYEVRASEPDRLRTRFSIEHQATKPKEIHFYTAIFEALPASDTSWFVLPYRSGVLMRTDKVAGSEKPSPGQMWMQWMGYYDNAGNGLLVYPEDRMGFLKFAQYGTDKTRFRMAWDERVALMPGQAYQLPYDYVIRPLPARDTFNDLARAYGEYGRGQTWAATTLKDKIALRPGLETLIKHGVVKFVGLGGLQFQDGGQGVFKDKEFKENMASVEMSFERALNDARTIETTYQTKPAYRYDGWWGRFDAEYPFVFPIHEKLGGDEKFAWFLQENAKENRDIILHLNPVQYDGEDARFNIDHMLTTADGSPQKPWIWSGNNLFQVSPYLGIPDNLETLLQLRQMGARGVFWDVIGASSPYIDYNPRANYPYFGRETFYQGLLHLFEALRNTAPGMIYGTEDGQEQMLPYFDYAPVYAYDPKLAEVGKAVTETWAPLPELVYGDLYANTVGIDANYFTFDDRARAIRYLYGVSLGSDGRANWVKDYSPAIRQTFESNEIIAIAAQELMSNHHIDPAGWRASIWPSLVVIANTGSAETIEKLSVNTPLGQITIKGLRPSGIVMVNREGYWSAWGAQEVARNGQLLVQVSNPDSIIVRNSNGFSLASYGFPHLPDTDPIKGYEKLDQTAWTVRLEPKAQELTAKLQVWPGAEAATFEKKDDTLVIPAPGFDRTLQSPR